MHLLTRRATLLGRAASLTLVAGLLAGAGVAAAGTAAQAAANPYERGPAPTTAGLERQGSFQVQELTAQSPSGFAAGKIYAPTDASKTYGAIAIVPGFVSSWDSIKWIGPRLASHGFVVIGIDTITPFDLPAGRGEQLSAALKNLLADSRVKARIDPSRTAVAGWSMGGGGTLELARSTPGLKAIVAWAPWDLEKNWSGIRVPALFIGDEFDELAPNNEHASVFYTSVQGPKAYANLALTDHFYVWNDNPQQSRLTVSWFKRYLDNDTRYTPFLNPGPPLNPFNLKEYKVSGVN